MIYVFENPNNSASVVYDGDILSPTQKEKAVQVYELPIPENNQNKQAILKVSKTENRVWYEYIDSDVAINELEQLRLEMARGNAEMFEMMVLMMGGETE